MTLAPAADVPVSLRLSCPSARFLFPVSHRVPRAPWYSGYRFGPPHFRLRGSHPLRPRFPSRSARMACSYSCGPTTPSGIAAVRFGLLPFRSPLLGECNHCLFSCGYMRCFSSPRSLAHPMYSDAHAAALPAAGFPIRISPDRSLFAAPRGFSQLTTSFIGSQRQGILRVPFVA